MSKPETQRVRVPMMLTPGNLAALDSAAVEIRQATGRFVARTTIINKLIARTDFARFVKEFGK